MRKEWIPKEWWGSEQGAYVRDKLATCIGDVFTTSVNHADCGDTRGRLRVSRVQDGGFLAYCHNCQARGYWRGIKALVDGDLGRDIGGGLIRENQSIKWFPEDIEDVTSMYPGDARVLRNMGIPTAWIGALSPVLLSAADLTATYEGYHIQFRNDDGLVYCGQEWYRNEDGSKTHVHTGYVENTTVPLGRASVVDVRNRFNPPGPKACVIVEDRVSAMLGSYVVPDAHWISLHGSHMDTYDMAKIANYYEKAIIWLDNDKTEVIEKANLYSECFDLMGVKSPIVRVFNEPKKQRPEHVMEALRKLGV